MLFAAVLANQVPYDGPVLDLVLNGSNCGVDSASDLDNDAHITKDPHPANTYTISLNKCNLHENLDASNRWATVNSKPACSCRNDYPAWLTLPAEKTPTEVKDSPYCSGFEAAYGWLYAEPTPGLKWMTIPPRSNVPIDVNLNGQEFNPPDGDKPKFCTGLSLIERSNFCFYGVTFPDLPFRCFNQD